MKEVIVMVVGNLAPSFTADALVNGKMQKVSLEGYRGKWVVLFFYSGDFSFV
jgi:alkyl hydroperoxide reductase subunit AhpC